MRIAGIMLFVFLLVPACLLAQKPTYYLNPDKELIQYNYERWSSNNGLPTNSLLYVHHSSQGYLWVSSYAGLMRYDGVNFKVFNNVNTDVLNTNVVRNIAEDQNGTLWLTTQGSGLISYSEGRFTAHGIDEGLSHLYRGLLVDKNNRVWSASPDKGWFYFENGQFNFIEYNSPLNNIEIRAIAQSKTGAIWFGTLGEGLFKYENGILKKYSMDNGLISDWVYSLHVDADDNLWIGTNNGLCYFDGRRFHHSQKDITSTVSSIISDRFENLWIGSQNGLYRLTKFPHKLEQLTADNGLSNNFIIDMSFDQEGSLWITHYKGGLTRIKDGKFYNYTNKGGLPGKVVNTVFETHKGNLLVGFDNGHLIEIENGKINECRLNNSIKDKRVRDVMIDTHGNMWVSTYKGLLKSAPNGNEQWFNEKNGFFDNQFRLTFQDSKGNIWVGSRNNGVALLQNDRVAHHFNTDNGLLSNLVMAIEEDAEGNIWVGTSEGMGCLNRITPTLDVLAFTKNDGFNSNIVFNIYPEKNGNVWLATVNGLWLYQNQQFINLTTKQGLADNTLYDVLEDELGYFWMPFDNGVMKVKKLDLLAVVSDSLQHFECRVYDRHDGMPNSECNPTSKALRMKNGSLVFPTLDGLSIIDPHDEIINNYIPPVIIEEIIVDQQMLLPKPNMVFEPNNTRYTFKFTGLSLYEPLKMQFKYQLKGFDNDWILTNDRSVSYTNLPYGDYSFSVIASNNDGVWNQQGATLTFNIQPNFNKTIAFYIIVLIGSFLLVFFMYVLIVERYRRNQVKLEQSVAKRTREVVEKNEALELLMSEVKNQNTKLQLQKQEIQKQTIELERQKEELNDSIQSKDKIFSIISHDLRSPLGNIKNMLALLIDRKDQFNESKKEVILENLSEITKSTFYLLDNLLNWSRSQRGLITFDPQMFLVAPLINEVVNLVNYQKTKKEITIESHFDESDLVYGDTNMVKTIFRNILENAVKFTPKGGNIRIKSEIKSDYITFIISDNGVGMTPNQIYNLLHDKEITSTYGTNREKGSGLGLLLCKDFIKKNGGHFDVESKPNEGSSFFVSLKRFQV